MRGYQRWCAGLVGIISVPATGQIARTTIRQSQHIESEPAAAGLVDPEVNPSAVRNDTGAPNVVEPDPTPIVDVNAGVRVLQMHGLQPTGLPSECGFAESEPNGLRPLVERARHHGSQTEWQNTPAPNAPISSIWPARVRWKSKPTETRQHTQSPPPHERGRDPRYPERRKVRLATNCRGGTASKYEHQDCDNEYRDHLGHARRASPATRRHRQADVPDRSQIGGIERPAAFGAAVFRQTTQ